jgi:hypothetical protein
MDEFIKRQHNQIRFAIEDYRKGLINLNRLIQKLEGLAKTIGESFWNDQMYPLVVELELLNSELLDKRREPTCAEEDSLNELLKVIEQAAG